MDIISRKDATDAKMKRYFTGVPCKYDHLNERYTSNGGCTICSGIRRDAWNDCNVEKVKITKKKYRDKNSKNRKLYQAKYRSQNIKIANLYAKKWRKNNPEKCVISQAKRRARKSNAIDLSILKSVFIMIEKRKKVIIEETGIQHHIDHFIPLSKGGMHTPSNLRIIPSIVNQRKSANIWTEKHLEDICRNYYAEQKIIPSMIDDLVLNYKCDATSSQPSV